MCAQILPLLLSAAGSGAQLINSNEAQHQQDRIASETLRRNAGANRRGGERVSQEIKAVAESSPDAERAAADADFTAALKKAQLQSGGDALGGPGGASTRFEDDLGLARTAAEGEGKALAGRIAAIDAPQYQRTRENIGFANAGTDLSLLADQNRGQDFLDQLRLSRATPNAGVDAAGSLLTGLGAGMANRALPVGAAPTPGAVSNYGRPVRRAFGAGYGAVRGG